MNHRGETETCNLGHKHREDTRTCDNCAVNITAASSDGKTVDLSQEVKYDDENNHWEYCSWACFAEGWKTKPAPNDYAGSYELSILTITPGLLP